MSIGVNKFKSQEAHSLSLTSLSINKLKCQLFPQSTTFASLVWASIHLLHHFLKFHKINFHELFIIRLPSKSIRGAAQIATEYLIFWRCTSSHVHNFFRKSNLQRLLPPIFTEESLEEVLKLSKDPLTTRDQIINLWLHYV